MLWEGGGGLKLLENYLSGTQFWLELTVVFEISRVLDFQGKVTVIH